MIRFNKRSPTISDGKSCLDLVGEKARHDLKVCHHSDVNLNKITVKRPLRQIGDSEYVMPEDIAETVNKADWGYAAVQV